MITPLLDFVPARARFSNPISQPSMHSEIALGPKQFHKYIYVNNTLTMYFNQMKALSTGAQI